MSRSEAGVTLTPGSSCTLMVRYTPMLVGLRRASLSVSWSGGSVSADLSGTNVRVPAAAVAITPIAHDFGSVTVGQTGDQAYSMTNNGPPIQGFNGWITTNSEEFHVDAATIEQDPCFLVTFYTGATCHFHVVFGL